VTSGELDPFMQKSSREGDRKPTEDRIPFRNRIKM